MTITATSSFPTRENIGPYPIIQKLDDWPGYLLAEDKESHSKVAVKLIPLNADQSAPFLEEAHVLLQLNHENIVPILDAGVAENKGYLVMEYLQGESLSDRLKRENKFGRSDLIRLARDIACALAAAHDLGIIHHDLNPTTVWLDSKGAARLHGFGTGLNQANDPLLRRLDHARVPGYLAPEQAAGEKLTSSIDLFALGCLIYRLASGIDPFRADNSVAYFRAIIFDYPKPIKELVPDLPDGLCELVNCLLAKMPHDRPANALIVVEHLNALLALNQRKPAQSSATKETEPSVASRRILESLATQNPAPPSRLPGLARVDVLMEAPKPPPRKSWLPDLIAGILLVAAATGLYLWWKISNDAPIIPAVKLESAKP